MSMKQVESDYRDTICFNGKGDGDINWMIKAGAGAGKTTLLSHRICKQILAGTRIEEFVVITYTNAAAAELRFKIQERLVAVISEGGLTSDEINRAETALQNLELMQVSTIHSFLLCVLRENAFEVNIALDAVKIESDADEARKEYYCNSWIKNPDNLKELYNLLPYGFVHYQKTNNSIIDLTRVVFRNMFTSVANLREESMILNDGFVAMNPSQLDDRMNAYIDRWMGVLSRFAENIPKYVPMPSSTNEIINKISEAYNIRSSNPEECAKCVFKAVKGIRDANYFYGKGRDAGLDIPKLPEIPKGARDTKYIKDNDWPNNPEFKKCLDLLVGFKDRIIASNNTALGKGPQGIYDSIKDLEKEYSQLSTDNQRFNLAIRISLVLTTIKAKLDEKAKDSEQMFYGKDKDDSRLEPYFPKYPSAKSEWDFYSFYQVYSANKIATLVNRVKDEYQKYIDADPLKLSDDDILYLSKKLFVEHEDILDRYRNKYKKIYVDEFQDTTKLQSDIVRLLSEKPGSKLDDNDYIKGKLVVVGDPKQSIYRFTGAELQVFNDVDHIINNLSDTLGQSVDLGFNFRSNKAIVDKINGYYSSLMGSNYSPMDTDWEITDPTVPAGIFRYSPKTDTYKKEDDIQTVISLIKRLVNKEYCQAEQRDKTRRPIKYSDIMVLVKNTTNMSDYVDAFAKENIPVDVLGKAKVGKEEVLRNFILLTDFFAGNKNRRVKLTAVLVKKGMDITTADKKILDNEISEMWRIASGFKKRNMDSAAIVQYLLSREEWYFPKDKEIDEQGVKVAKIRLHQMVEACLQKCNGDLRELVAIMNDYMDSVVAREVPLESDIDAVRFMNVHKSKGLTGQIVIIADRSNKEECKYSSFKKNGSYYPSAAYKLYESGTTNFVPTYTFTPDLMEIAEREETEELIRLQYVAATRAAQALIILPAIEITSWFSNAVYDYNSLDDINEWLKDKETAAGQSGDNSSEDSPSTSVSIHKVCLSDLCELKGKVSAELSDMQRINIAPSELGISVDSKNDKATDTPEDHRPCGNIFGTVMHRVFELLVGKYQDDRVSFENGKELIVERAINQAILESRDKINTSDEAMEFFDYLKPKMLNYVDSVLRPILDSASEVYTEYCFSFYVDEDEKEEFMKSFSSYYRIKKEDEKTGDSDSTASTDVTDDLDDYDLVLSDENENNSIDSDEPIKPEDVVETKTEKQEKAIIMNSTNYPGKIWVNGQADLVVVQKDGIIKVYDYKSNKRGGSSIDSFRKHLDAKYEGQLKLYSYAMKKVFGDEKLVETQLIDLYQDV